MDETIVLPGGYTGDMWHVAGAMLVREHVHAVVTYHDADERHGAHAMAGFFQTIGLGDRVTEQQISLRDSPQLGTRKVASLTKIEEELGGKSLAWQHLAGFQATLAEGTQQLVHPVYRSTSMIMRLIEERGKKETLAALGAGLTGGLPQEKSRFIAAHVKAMLDKYAGKKLLFVLGRVSKYNPQHSLTSERLVPIGSAASKEGYLIIGIGDPEAVAKLANVADVAFEGCIDLRNWATLTGADEADERARAFFWRCLVDCSEKREATVRFIGGRSGSTDVAAFMGAKVLCWDQCDVYNPEYLRLLIMSPELLAVTHTDYDHRRASVTIAPSSLQFEEDVASFLQGTYATPKLQFRISGNVAKKEAGTLPDLKRACLWRVARMCETIFATEPRPFSGLFDAIHSTAEINDLGSFLTFKGGARSGRV